MAKFNISNLHIFDKRGNELPIVFDSTFKILIENELNDDAIFYGVLNPENEIEGFYKKSTGGRFREKNFIDENHIKCQVYFTGKENEEDSIAAIAEVVRKESKYVSSFSNSKFTEYYIDDIVSLDIDHTSHNTTFSSLTFNTGFTFDKVSTELVETESLYVLVEDTEDGQITYSKFDEDYIDKHSEAKDWAERYKLLFFIDCREQEDFRIFEADTDEIVWNNKKILDFTKGDFRVNVGFTAGEEGLYEENIIVCLLDYNNLVDGEPEIYPVGSIHMNAEAVGEDERYRALFDNFGIPHPREYMDVFNDADPNEGLVDNIVLNKNAKKIFLTYNDIFPYVGTYKALMTAVELLGYNDIFFKEWYKEIGKSTSNGAYVSYDMQYKASPLARTINSISIEERIRLKKLNWISMVYKINEQIFENGEDKYGFPDSQKLHTYDDTSLIVKLVALRDWLQKYVIGLNCRIIDIAGEGVYFERYKLDAYGTYQTLIDWDNEHNIAPYIEESDTDNVIQNGEATINVNVGVEDYDMSIEDIAQHKFIDYCEGYITDDNIYHRKTSALSDNSSTIYVGSTLECFNELNSYFIKASSTTDNFLFNSDMLYSDVDSSINSASLRVYNNEIFFNPYDIFLNHNKQTIFKKCPIIQLERANIRVFSKNWKNSVVYKIYPDTRDNTLSSYFIKNMLSGKVQSTIDYVTLIPPKVNEETFDKIILSPAMTGQDVEIEKYTTPKYYSDFEIPNQVFKKLNASYGLKYSSENIYNLPLFSIIGYQVDKIEDNIKPDVEYILDILDGKMIFIDEENERKIYLNFYFDDYSNKQIIEVNIEYMSDEFSVVSYMESDSSVGPKFNNFIDGKNYKDFVNNYTETPENAIAYDANHKIKVHNAGTFTVDVFGKDLFNNIFAAKCLGNPYVGMPDLNMFTFTNTETSGNSEKDDKPILTGESIIAGNTENETIEDNILGGRLVFMTPEETAAEELKYGMDFDGNGVIGNGYTDIASIPLTKPTTEEKEDTSFDKEEETKYTPHSVKEMLSEQFIDFCIYRPSYLIQGIGTSINNKEKTISVSYPSYSYSLPNGNVDDIIRFIDITDKYNVKVLDNVKSATTNKTKDVYTYEGYNLIVEPGGISKYGKIIERQQYDAIAALNNNVYPDEEGRPTVSSLLSRFYSSKYDFSGVNLIYFNELAGFPCVQTYADMANELAFFKKSEHNAGFQGDYKINVEDDSWRGYVWAKIKDCAAANIVNGLEYVILEKNVLDKELYDWTMYGNDNGNAARYKETIIIENPSKEDEDDNIPDTLEVQRYINPVFDSSAKNDVFTSVSDFIINNYKTSSIYWLDSSSYWFGNYTASDVINNLNDNNSLEISSSEIEISEEELNEVETTFHAFRENLSKMQSVTCEHSEIVDDMNLVNLETSYDKYQVYPYLLDTTLNNISSESSTNKMILTLPYTDKGKTISTNMFYNVAGLLANKGYKEAEENEIKKIYIDYSTPFELNEPEVGGKIDTIINRFANDLLNESTLPIVTDLSEHHYVNSDICHTIYYNDNDRIKIIDNGDDLTLFCTGIGTQGVEELYALDGDTKEIVLEMPLNSSMYEKYIGLSYDPFPRLDEDSPLACKEIDYGVHIVGKWVNEVTEIEKDDYDAIDTEIWEKYIDTEIKKYSIYAELIIDRKYKTRYSIDTSTGDSNANDSSVDPSEINFTFTYNHCILDLSKNYKVRITLSDVLSKGSGDNTYNAVDVNVQLLEVNDDIETIVMERTGEKPTNSVLYPIIGLSHSETIDHFKFEMNSDVKNKIGQILKSSRSDIIPSSWSRGECNAATVRTIIERFISTNFDLNEDLLKECVKIACNRLHDVKLFTPYCGKSIEDPVTELSLNGSVFNDALADLLAVFKTYNVKYIDNFKFNGRTIQSILSGNSYYFPVINEGDIDSPTDSDDVLSIITSNYVAIITLLFKNMYSIRSIKTADLRYNNSSYNAILYTIYAYILYRIMFNMTSIAYTLNENFDKYTLVDGCDTVLAKYLMMTEANLIPASYNIVKSIAEGTEAFFFDYDCSAGIYKTSLQDLKDDTYIAQTFRIAGGLSYIVDPDKISLYDKILTIKSRMHFDILKYRNWVLKGEVTTKENGVDDALYAVVSNFKKKDKGDSDYLTDIDEVDSSTVNIDESVAISNNKTADSSVYNDFNEERDTIGDLVNIGNILFYVKTAGHAEDGYITWTKSLPENATTSVKEMLNQNYISAYVKPNWKIPVNVTLIDTSKPQYSSLDPSKDYIYISYKNNYFTPLFNIGEKVKLVSESTISSLYYAQATYKVVGYDLNNMGIILEGKFNSEYINNDDDLVWHQIRTAIKNGVRYMINNAGFEIGELNYNIASLEQIIELGYEVELKDDNGVEYEFIENNVIMNGSNLFIYDTNEITLMNDHIYTTKKGEDRPFNNLFLVLPDEAGVRSVYTFTDNKIAKNNSFITMICDIPTLYNNDASYPTFKKFYNKRVNIPTKVIKGNYYHRVYTLAKINNEITPVFLTTSFSEKLNVFIAYSHQSYADYQMVIDDANETINGITTIDIKYTDLNAKTFDFLDDTFSITIDKFNPYEGQSAWMDSERLSTKWNDAEPEILKSDIYGYRDTTVVLPKSKNNIAFAIDLSETAIDPESCYNYWEVYKRDKFNNTNRFMFESYNPILYLNYDEPGIYDIKAIVFDKFGNMTSKMYNAAFIIK